MARDQGYSSTDHLTDQDFIESFENCTLPAAWFHHRDHIRLAWLYITRHGLLEALGRISEGIKRFATAQGKAERYHESITWAYAFLINQRLASADSNQTWAEFTALNADLLDWENNILQNYYHPETLSSELSRRIFVLPDRVSDTSNSRLPRP